MSESAVVNLILALSGGCMDAYSYLYRGEVFANAQTGNMLLFGVNAAGGDFAEAMKYFWPVITFTVGIILADFIRSRIQDVHVHWRQIVLVGEILVRCVLDPSVAERSGEYADFASVWYAGRDVPIFPGQRYRNHHVHW